jgi:hypothetical protein
MGCEDGGQGCIPFIGPERWGGGWPGSDGGGGVLS